LRKSRLEAASKRLQRALPSKARGWGTARKALNIFLRDAAYNKFLRDRFALHRAEALLEIPLDQLTAKQLRDEADDGELPEWPGVSHLTADTSAQFQAVAHRVAREWGIARVHLDVYWFGGDREIEA